jgi:hypothetical protein
MGAQSANADGASAGDGEHQYVGAGLGGRHGSIVERSGGGGSEESGARSVPICASIDATPPPPRWNPLARAIR